MVRLLKSFIDTTKILFIVGGAFNGIEKVVASRVGRKRIGFGTQGDEKQKESDVTLLLRQIEVDDLIKFGLIPEFAGRIPIISTLDELSEDDLVHILTQPRNALVRQATKLFNAKGVDLSFTEDALRAIAAKAMKRKGGARSLRSIVEETLLDIEYEVPYLEVEGPLNPYPIPGKGETGYVVVWNKHPLSVAAIIIAIKVVFETFSLRKIYPNIAVINGMAANIKSVTAAVV